MYRGLTVAVVAGALLCAAVAFGATKSYEGADSDGRCGTVADNGAHAICKVAFDAVAENGKVSTVSAFTYKGIPITCNEGTAAFSNQQEPAPDLKVGKQRRFEGHFSMISPDDTVTVTGRFSSDYQSASGTLRLKGDYFIFTGCDT